MPLCREEVEKGGTKLVGGRRCGTHGLLSLPSSRLRGPDPLGSLLVSSPTVALDTHEWISFEDDERPAHVGVRCHLLDAVAGAASTAPAARVCSTPTPAHMEAGLLQLRRPLRRRRRCADRGRRLRPLAPHHWQFIRKGQGGRHPRQRGRGHHHPSRRRGVHLPQPAGLQRWGGLRPPRRRRRGGRAAAGLEARRVLAATPAPRRPDRRARLRHLHIAGVETPRLGPRRRGVPLVVHRHRRGFRRCRACLRLPESTRSSNWSAARCTTSWWSCSNDRNGSPSRILS